MAGDKPSDEYQSDSGTAQDAELEQIMLRCDDAERRAAAVDAEWERFAAAVDAWAKEYGVSEPTSALLLRLVMLPPHLHETVPAPSGKMAEYNRLETAATSLLLRRRALEGEFIAVHEDFHDWARRYGVELVSEERETQTTWTEPMRLAGPARPQASIPNTWICRLNEETGDWTDIKVYCQPKILSAQEAGATAEADVMRNVE